MGWLILSGKKKFLAMTLGILSPFLVIILQNFGIDIPEDTVRQIIGLVVAYLGIEGAVDYRRHKNGQINTNEDPTHKSSKSNTSYT